MEKIRVHPIVYLKPNDWSTWELDAEDLAVVTIQQQGDELVVTQDSYMYDENGIETRETVEVERRPISTLKNKRLMFEQALAQLDDLIEIIA